MYNIEDSDSIFFQKSNYNLYAEESYRKIVTRSLELDKMLEQPEKKDTSFRQKLISLMEEVIKENSPKLVDYQLFLENLVLVLKDKNVTYNNNNLISISDINSNLPE